MTTAVSASPAPATHQPAAESAAAELARLREALFGDQSRQIEVRLQALSQQLESMRRDLADEVDGKVGALAGSSSQARSALQQEIADQLAQAAQQAARLDNAQRQVSARLEDYHAAQAASVQAVRDDVERRIGQLSDDADAASQSIAAARREIADRFDQQSAYLQAIDRHLAASLEQLSQLQAAQLNAVREALRRQTEHLAAEWRDQLQALSADLTGRIDRLSVAQDDSRAPAAPRSVRAAGRWAGAIRRWKHVRSDAQTAQTLVTFFRLAFEWLPEHTYQAAWFGVHADHISLTLGNLQLASVSAPAGQAQLLVDAGWRKPARSTRKYIPLGWQLRDWSRLDDWIASPEVWVSYAAAAEKIWAAPLARAVIRRNLARKTPLRALLRRVSQPR